MQGRELRGRGCTICTISDISQIPDNAAITDQLVIPPPHLKSYHLTPISQRHQHPPHHATHKNRRTNLGFGSFRALGGGLQDPQSLSLLSAHQLVPFRSHPVPDSSHPVIPTAQTHISRCMNQDQRVSKCQYLLLSTMNGGALPQEAKQISSNIPIPLVQAAAAKETLRLPTCQHTRIDTRHTQTHQPYSLQTNAIVQDIPSLPPQGEHKLHA